MKIHQPHAITKVVLCSFLFLVRIEPNRKAFSSKISKKKAMASYLLNGGLTDTSCMAKIGCLHLFRLLRRRDEQRATSIVVPLVMVEAELNV